MYNSSVHSLIFVALMYIHYLLDQYDSN